jgi:hypothetical protein
MNGFNGVENDDLRIMLLGHIYGVKKGVRRVLGEVCGVQDFADLWNHGPLLLVALVAQKYPSMHS